jgi:hypothetical protein
MECVRGGVLISPSTKVKFVKGRGFNSVRYISPTARLFLGGASLRCFNPITGPNTSGVRFKIVLPSGVRLQHIQPGKPSRASNWNASISLCYSIGCHSTIRKTWQECRWRHISGNRPLEPQAREVEFFPMEEVLHEEVKIHRQPDHGRAQAR